MTESIIRETENIFLSIILVIIIAGIMVIVIKCVGCKVNRDKVNENQIMVQQQSSIEVYDWIV